MPRYADSPGAATSKLHDRLEYIANANRLLDARKVIASSPKAASKSPRKTSRSRSPPSARRGPKGSRAGRGAHALFSATLVGGIGRRLGSLLYYGTMMALAVLLGGYLRYKFFYELPYCDNAVTLHKYLPKSMQLSILSSLSEMCIPCPIHGKCAGGRLSCLDGFIARRNWIAFGQDCVPDRRKLSLADDLATKVRQLLAERAGQAICGGIPELGRVVTAGELAALVRAKYPRAEWNSAQFDSFYRMALEDIGRNAAAMGIEVSHNPMYDRGREYAYLPCRDGSVMMQSRVPAMGVGCRMRLVVGAFYRAYRMKLWTGGLLLLSTLYLWFRLRTRSHQQRRVEELVQAVLQILAEQDALNRRDPTIPSSISIHQIRDALFFKSSARQRTTLWPVVCQAIGRNSNVRETVMSIKGEQHRVWEWIGSDVLSPLIRS